MSDESSAGTDRWRSLVRREDYYDTERDRVRRALECGTAASYHNPQITGRRCWWFWDRFWASLSRSYPSWGWETEPQATLEEFGGEARAQ